MHVDILFHDLSFLLAHKLSILKLNSFVLPRKIAWLFLLHVYLFVFFNTYACYTTFLAKNLYWEGMLLIHPKPWAKPMTFVSTITTYYVVFPAIPSKYFSATFKLFKSYHLLFVSMFYSSWGSMWCFSYQPCHLLMTDFHQWTSGIHIRLSNNFAKRAGKWGAQSRLITTLTINFVHIFSLIYQ